MTTQADKAVKTVERFQQYLDSEIDDKTTELIKLQAEVDALTSMRSCLRTIEANPM